MARLPGSKISWLLIALVAVIASFTASSANVTVNREMVAHFEREFDKRIAGYEPSDPFHLLGNTRGFYLEDYGGRFTSELNLVYTPQTSNTASLPCWEKLT